MNDFQTINEIVNESIRNSSYHTVALSSCVFIVYTLIVQLVSYFKSKNKTKPLLEMAESLKENTNNIIKLNNVLDKTLRDAERKNNRQCENAIKLGFDTFASKISQACVSIIVHNNIEENKELIVGNLNKLISTEYYKLYSSLSTYEVNEIVVNTKLKEDWIKEVTDAVLHIIYDGQDIGKRITHINSRLNVLISSYSTFVNNKIFNT